MPRGHRVEPRKTDGPQTWSHACVSNPVSSPRPACYPYYSSVLSLCHARLAGVLLCRTCQRSWTEIGKTPRNKTREMFSHGERLRPDQRVYSFVSKFIAFLQQLARLRVSSKLLDPNWASLVAKIDRASEYAF